MQVFVPVTSSAMRDKFPAEFAERLQELQQQGGHLKIEVDGISAILYRWQSKYVASLVSFGRLPGSYQVSYDGEIRDCVDLQQLESFVLYGWLEADSVDMLKLFHAVPHFDKISRQTLDSYR